MTKEMTVYRTSLHLEKVIVHVKTNIQGQQWPEHLRHEYAARWILHTLENGKPYDQTTWPSPSTQDKRDIPELLQPVEELVSTIPQEQPERNRNAESPFDEKEEPQRVRETLDAWKHNRQLYPGWLVFPSGQDRGELSRRTDEWEQPILNALPELAPVERLYAMRELIWRHEVLLDPLTQSLGADAQEILLSIDCEERTINDVEEPRGDWPDIREAWRTVGLALLTDARLDCKRALFEQRLDALKPFANDHVDVAHRLQHERCLWDIFSLDFESLNKRLDSWEVVNCDPIWMLRRAALLTEAGRMEESKPLVQAALNLIRENYARNGNIANASRESWALGSALTWDNQHAFDRRWDELASLKCDSMQEIDLSTSAIQGNDKRDEAPSFDLGVRNVTRTIFSGNNRYGIVAAYRGVRLLEVAGLPPTNNPGGKYSLSMSLGQRGVLTSATEQLVTIAPDLSIRLALRACSDEGDKTLGRVLTRTRVATLSEESVKTLAEICISAINYALPRLNSADTLPLFDHWVRLVRVGLEILSRLVLRLPSDSVAAALELSLDCLQNSGIRGNDLLGRPISNLLARSWNALSDEYRARYALRLLAASLGEEDANRIPLNLLDPGVLVVNSNVALVRSTDNEGEYKEVVNFLIRGLRGQDSKVREQATVRLFALVNAGSLTSNETDDIANILWSEADAVLDNPPSSQARDWMYLVLPELKLRQAEKSFRGKWLIFNHETGDNMANAGSVLAHVGMAIRMSRRYDYLLALSSEENEHLLTCVLKVVETLMKGGWLSVGVNPSEITLGIRTVIPILDISEDIGKDLYDKVAIMREGKVQREVLHPFFDVREQWTVFAYLMIPGLIKALPERIEEIAQWIRLGLTSDNDLQVREALSALRSWMSDPASDANSTVSPSEDLVREIGIVIATRRKVAIESALSTANWIFESGDTKHQETISWLVLQGLSYLVEDLRYDRRDHDYDDEDIPLLRFLCAQLAKSMAHKGYATSPAISRWLEIAKDDPLPEVRYAITTDDGNVS